MEERFSQKIEMFNSELYILITVISITVLSMSSASAIAAPKYRTYAIKSWHEYQRFTPSHLHSIQHYNQTCEEDAKLSGDHVMVLRDEIIKITGYYWYSNGFAAQNCAETDGYVDVRTGKKYPHGGEEFCQDIRR